MPGHKSKVRSRKRKKKATIIHLSSNKRQGLLKSRAVIEAGKEKKGRPEA